MERDNNVKEAIKLFEDMMEPQHTPRRKFNKLDRTNPTMKRSSSPLPSIMRPFYSSHLETSYTAWQSKLENPLRFFTTRGTGNSLPGIVSGHFVMYDEERRKKRAQDESESNSSAVELAPTNNIESLERKLNRRNASIIDKLIPFMTERLFNVSLNASRLFGIKKERRQQQQQERSCLSDVTNCRYFVEVAPLGVVYGADKVQVYEPNQ